MKLTPILVTTLLWAGIAMGAWPGNVNAVGDSELFHDNEFVISVFSDYSHNGDGGKKVTRLVKGGNSDSTNKRDTVSPTSGVTFNPYKDSGKSSSGGNDRRESFNEPVSALFGRQNVFGGGISATGFFKRYFGLAVQIDGLAGSRAVGLIQGKLLARYPMEFNLLGARRGVAPYIFIGGGGTFGLGPAFLEQAGAGIEFRLHPGVTLFIDGACIFTRNEYDELVRIGFGLVF